MGDSERCANNFHACCWLQAAASLFSSRWRSSLLHWPAGSRLRHRVQIPNLRVEDLNGRASDLSRTIQQSGLAPESRAIARLHHVAPSRTQTAGPRGETSTPGESSVVAKE